MNLYDYCKENKIEVKLACEVGFYRLKDSQIAGFIYAGIHCIIIDILKSNIGIRYKNVEYRRIGIDFKEGQGIFKWNGASTHMIGLLSPSVQNKSQKIKYKGSRKYKVTTFDKIDNGEIDIICIDIEGLDYAVLKNMKSRPRVIAIEMQWRNYRNPYFKNIRAWMRYHNYKLVAYNKSDEIYRKTA